MRAANRAEPAPCPHGAYDRAGSQALNEDTQVNTRVHVMPRSLQEEAGAGPSGGGRLSSGSGKGLPRDLVFRWSLNDEHQTAFQG